MKLLFSAIFLLTSLSALATTQALLLDASCKVTCITSVTEIQNDQGSPTYNREYKNTYVDFLGLTREQLDIKTQSAELTKLCKEKFTQSSMFQNNDCLYLKHF